MKLKLRKYKRLKKFKDVPFTAQDAYALGISRRMLHYYVRMNKIQRISHGLYALPDYNGIDFISLIKEKLIQIPRGIVGLKTALKFYDLIEENPEVVDILVPKSHSPKRKLEDVQIYRIKDELHSKEITKIKGIPVTKIERTLVDLLRIGEPMSSVFEVIKTCTQKNITIDFALLKKLSKTFRVKQKVERILESLF